MEEKEANQTCFIYAHVSLFIPSLIYFVYLPDSVLQHIKCVWRVICVVLYLLVSTDLITLSCQVRRAACWDHD